MISIGQSFQNVFQNLLSLETIRTVGNDHMAFGLCLNKHNGLHLNNNVIIEMSTK